MPPSRFKSYLACACASPASGILIYATGLTVYETVSVVSFLNDRAAVINLLNALPAAAAFATMSYINYPTFLPGNRLICTEYVIIDICIYKCKLKLCLFGVIPYDIVQNCGYKQINRRPQSPVVTA